MGGGQSHVESKPVRMPLPDDPEAVARKNRMLEMMKLRGGRSATILSDALKNNANGAGGAMGQ